MLTDPLVLRGFGFPEVEVLTFLINHHWNTNKKYKIVSSKTLKQQTGETVEVVAESNFVVLLSTNSWYYVEDTLDSYSGGELAFPFFAYKGAPLSLQLKKNDVVIYPNTIAFREVVLTEITSGTNILQQLNLKEA